MTSDPLSLTGGRTNKTVVRIGDTVRRLPGPSASFAHRLLQYLEQHGFCGAPRFLGFDELGRETLSFIEGTVPPELGLFSSIQTRAAAQLLRTFHDITAGSALRGSDTIVCHGDPSPCNFVFQAGVPIALIDFDAAHPGPRRADVGYAAWLWLDLGNLDLRASDQGTRLADFIAAYGALPLADAVPAVIDAQRELASRVGAPLVVRQWAAGCQDWTERHLAELLHVVNTGSGAG